LQRAIANADPEARSKKARSFWKDLSVASSRVAFGAVSFDGGLKGIDRLDQRIHAVPKLLPIVLQDGEVREKLHVGVVSEKCVDGSQTNLASVPGWL
jgi:hypothetical protein